MGSGPPTFLILADHPGQIGAAAAVAERVRGKVAPVLGFAPRVSAAPLRLDGSLPLNERTLAPLDEAITRAIADGSAEVFLLPAVLDLNIDHKQLMVESVRAAQRRHGDAQIHYDDVDPCHPLLLHAFVDRAAEALSALERARPGRLGLLLVASGDGDPDARAQSYRLMRLLWESLRCARGDVAFLRHERTPLPEQLEACARAGLDWIVVPEILWPSEHLEYARVILDDFNRRRDGAEAGGSADRLGSAEAGGFPFPLARPIGDHPNIVGWLEQRALALFRSHRARQDARLPGARHAEVRPSRVHGPRESRPLGAIDGRIDADLRYGDGVIADLSDAADLGPLLEAYGLRGGRCFVKVTWHGYATGTYTDPVALDALLSALPGPAVVIEGHTSSRNRGGADWDWETDSRAHRAWIERQDREYRERTGLAAVLLRHRATYLNVTEAYWDGACADPARVLRLLAERGVTLHHEELAGYVPEALLEHRGAPFISYARFKGPTRLALSNLFGLLPPPLRSAWHGPNITYFARVCCDLARLYGALFDVHGIVESLSAAVRWDRQGMYRSRWGNYDLVATPGLVTLGPGLATPDVLASRLQGQDVTRSAFFDVVAHELGFPPELSELPIDDALVRRLV